MKQLENLRKWVKGVHQYTIFLLIIEVICTVLISLSASQVKEFQSAWTLLLIFSAVIFFIILLTRFAYLKNFPITLVDTIKNEFNSYTLEESSSRISLINNSIANSLIALNSQTCVLDGQYEDDPDTESLLCSKGINEGLNSVLSDFLQNLHFITESPRSKFTVGIYINHICEDPGVVCPDIYSVFGSKTLVLKDALELAPNIMENHFDEQGLSGDSLEIQNCLQTSFNNNRSHTQQISNERFKIYCNIIPVVCDEYSPSGVLYIIGDKFDSVPNDLDEVTKIYTRIIANWVNKYNDCVIQRITKRNTDSALPES